MKTPTTLQPGQIWLNTSDDPILVVRTPQGGIRVVAFHYTKRNMPTLIDDWTPNLALLDWKYVGMLDLTKGE